MFRRLLYTAAPTSGSFAAAFQHLLPPPFFFFFCRGCFSLNRILQTHGVEPAAWLGVPPQTQPSSRGAVSPMSFTQTSQAARLLKTPAAMPTTRFPASSARFLLENVTTAPTAAGEGVSETHKHRQSGEELHVVLPSPHGIVQCLPAQTRLSGPEQQRQEGVTTA